MAALSRKVPSRGIAPPYPPCLPEVPLHGISIRCPHGGGPAINLPENLPRRQSDARQSHPGPNPPRSLRTSALVHSRPTCRKRGIDGIGPAQNPGTMLPGHPCPARQFSVWNVQVEADYVEPFAVLPVAAPRGSDGVERMRDGPPDAAGGISAASCVSRLRAPLRAALCPICRHEPRRPRALSPGHSRTAHARRTKPLLDRAAWCPPLSPRFCRGPEFRACLAARLEKIQCQRAC